MLLNSLIDIHFIERYYIIKIMTTSSNSDLESETAIKHNSDNSLLSESSENLTDYSSETSSFRKV